MTADSFALSIATASLPRRLAAIFYDTLLLVALEMVAAALWLPVFGDRPATEHPLYHLYQLSLLLVACAFFMGFWLHGGQTLGMRSWRLRLRTSEGGTPSFRQAALGFAGASRSWRPAGLGVWWALLDPKRRTWHDLLSGTVLVLEPKRR